ncbi:Hypothetical_protein [Hexamita inflata]|uniref:Hypothetical_protein n=1 Tax=Hexamita inflata TaxID=28002 RepID=A0AA86RBL3_9EUKA|nr:Hypothetical protein HINF_LOCUS63079 [Hexamita inflata]
MQDYLKLIQEKLQKIVSEYKFEIKKPPENNFNTFLTKVNPRLYTIIPNYQPPKLNGKENSQIQLKQDELERKFQSELSKLDQTQINLQKMRATFKEKQTMKLNEITRQQNELKKIIIQQQKKLVNNKKKEQEAMENDQEKLFKIKREFKKTLAIIEEVQQILSEHRGLDPLLTKNTSMLNALLQAIYNTDAGYNAILRGPNDRETRGQKSYHRTKKLSSVLSKLMNSNPQTKTTSPSQDGEVVIHLQKQYYLQSTTVYIFHFQILEQQFQGIK